MKLLRFESHKIMFFFAFCEKGPFLNPQKILHNKRPKGSRHTHIAGFNVENLKTLHVSYARVVRQPAVSCGVWDSESTCTRAPSSYMVRVCHATLCPEFCVSG